MKTYNIQIIKKFETPKWWNNFIGQTFQCHKIDNEWHLTNIALEKLSRLKKQKTYSALILNEYGEIVPEVKQKTVKSAIQPSNEFIDQITSLEKLLKQMKHKLKVLEAAQKEIKDIVDNIGSGNLYK